METNLPTPMNARVYVNLPEGNVFFFFFLGGFKTTEQLRNKLIGFDREVILFGILVTIIG